MRVFITGATGLLGRRIVLDRLERGDDVALLSRRPSFARELFAAATNPRITVVEGDPSAPGSWQQQVDGCNAVVHLAGAGIADRRWSAAYKQVIARSRVEGTRQVVEAIAAARTRPAAFVSGSAAGFYGDTADRPTDESAPPGSDFLASLCQRWEQESMRAAEAGVRVVLLRTGVVLDDRGGALQRMVTPFQLFVGGPIGRGRQYMSWVHWRDIVGLVDLALRDRSLAGPMNAVAPNPVTSREFASTLGRVLRRPSWAPVPWLALRVLLGELANYLVMSQRVVPEVALHHEYHFLYPALADALRSLLQPADSTSSASATDRQREARGGRHPRTRGPSRAAASALVGAGGHRPAKAARPPAPVKLLAIDVDGTLLTSSGRLSPTVVQACRAAERAGCTVVLASGRPPRSVRGILQTLGTGPIVIANHGALVWDMSTKSVLHHQPLPAETARRIIDTARAIQGDLLVGLELLDRWGTDRFDPQFGADEARLMAPDLVAPLDELLGQPVTKLNLLREPERLPRIVATLRDEFDEPGLVSMYFTNPHLLQITDARADKGAAMAFVAAKLGLRLQEVMAIGDAANDLGMVRQAGFGVAVANAEEPIRDAADVVVESNDEHGVAFAIQRYVLAR